MVHNSQALFSNNLPQTMDLNTAQPAHITLSQTEWLRRPSKQLCKNLLKNALADNKDPYLALLEYHNTPLSDQSGSPTQRLMGRRTKTLIPTSEKLLQPKIISPNIVVKEMRQRKEKQNII